jgi:Flp pilus assembly protein TadD
LGQILYDRGDFDGAAAAWRLAAAKRHAEAASSLGMLLEQTGDAEGARKAYRDARRLGDPDGAERGRP